MDPRPVDIKIRNDNRTGSVFIGGLAVSEFWQWDQTEVRPKRTPIVKSLYRAEWECQDPECDWIGIRNHRYFHTVDNIKEFFMYASKEELQKRVDNFELLMYGKAP